jgi:DNA-binding protein HU-beta
VNKSELIEHIAKHAEISRAAAGRSLMAMTGGVTQTLKKGKSVSLPGLGTFSVAKGTVRRGRSSRAQAARVLKFRVSKALRDVL